MSVMSRRVQRLMRLKRRTEKTERRKPSETASWKSTDTDTERSAVERKQEKEKNGIDIGTDWASAVTWPAEDHMTRK